ncbi:hypothetical protein ACSREC_38420, partial [Salmonella enterica]|uniref:hypothetical protein n=1 Tax=Salmonella sp. 741265071_PSA TaxID=3388996 RepID=UPI00397FE5E8
EGLRRGMGESDEPGPFRSVVNLMPDDANAYPAYRLICPPGKKIPAQLRGFFIASRPYSHSCKKR